MTLSFDHIYNRFGIAHHPRQQVSYATLLDADGNVVAGVAPLECDGADHARGIEGVVDDYWNEQDRLNGTGDYADTIATAIRSGLSVEGAIALAELKEDAAEARRTTERAA